MPSPFPGMDPYLEDPAYWPGFHLTMIVYITNAIVKQLPKRYFADIDKHQWYEPSPRDEWLGKRREHRLSAIKTAIGITPANFETEFISGDESRNSKYVKILELTHDRVVTVITLLRPEYKEPGAARTSYLHFRNNCELAGINLVEIDLLRQGDRLPVGKTKPP